jgi:hypothetical protein
MRKLILGLLGFGLGVGIGAIAALSGAGPSTAALDQDLAEIHKEISASEQEASTYSAGLILMQIQSRLATLRNTEAMLAQKRLSWLRGIELGFAVNGLPLTPATPEQLSRVERDMEAVNRQIAHADAEASLYSGGLLKITSELAAAMHKMTLATLQYSYFQMKYGLAAAKSQDIMTNEPPPKPQLGTVVPDKDAL